MTTPKDYCTIEDVKASMNLTGTQDDDALQAAIFRLYANHHAFTDDAYPGEGGWELRTIHNPFGHGRNAVLLGGSAFAGAEAAAEHLLGMLAGGGAVRPAVARAPRRDPRIRPACRVPLRIRARPRAGCPCCRCRGRSPGTPSPSSGSTGP